MENTPKVSVIIPVYNTEKYLRQCLDSVVNQTLKDIEIICVDDGSTDGSPEILQEYKCMDNRVKILQQQNLGAGAARNLGIEVATGKYLYFMDSDDYCEYSLLEEATIYAEKNEADIVVFDYCKFDAQTGAQTYCNGLSKNKLPKNKNTFSYRDIPQNICNIVIPTPWNKLFFRERIIECGLRYLPISTTNDITFSTMAVITARKVVYLEKMFLHYRVNFSGSITSKKQDKLNNVITAVLEVDKQAKKLDFYSEIRNSIQVFIISNLFVALERYAGDETSIQYAEYLKQIDSILYSYPLFIDIQETDLRNRNLFGRVMECRCRAMERHDFSYAPTMIVSMTSFPERIQTVHIAIHSLYMQTKKPDRILLYLAKNQFPNGEKDLPQKLLDYRRSGLEIRWCKEDIRPHKKYFYAMQEFPDSLIVTVDDDLRYEPRMLEMLFASYLKYPHAVSAMRTHLIVKNEDGEIASYSEWKKEFSGVIGIPSMQLFSTSGAGTLFPPACMSNNVFDLEKIQELCPNADDIWLKVMQVLVGTPVVLVQPNKCLQYIEDTQKKSLQVGNVFRMENDIQLQNVLSVYGRIGEQDSVTKRIFATTVGLSQATTNKPKQSKKIDDLKFVEIERENIFLKKEIQAIHLSWSYRIGRFITFIPRKVRGGIRCYQEHGLHYTLYRIRDKFLALVGG